MNKDPRVAAMNRILLSRGVEIAGEVFAGLTMVVAVLALWLA